MERVKAETVIMNAVDELVSAIEREADSPYVRVGLAREALARLAREAIARLDFAGDDLGDHLDVLASCARDDFE